MSTYLGSSSGQGGAFGRRPFYVLQLAKWSTVLELDQLLSRADASGRGAVVITATFHQPDRLRLLQVPPPEYEAQAASNYLRGDVARVQGREGVSLNVNLSARWGVPAFRRELCSAADRAEMFVLFRVPSRKRDLIELVPDAELRPAEEEVLSEASATAAAQLLPPEDFSDWER